MAKYVLIGDQRIGTTFVGAGSIVDETDSKYAALVAAGASLWPDSDTIVHAAALKAQSLRVNAGQSGEAIENLMTAAVEASQKATEATSTAALPFKRSITIGFAELAGLAGGVKTFDKNDAAGALPAGARLKGFSIDSFTGFDDATHGTYTVSLGGAAAADMMAAVSVAAGATAGPKIGAAAAKGYQGAPHAAETLVARLTGGPDLNTATAGAVTISAWFEVLP